MGTSSLAAPPAWPRTASLAASAFPGRGPRETTVRIARTLWHWVYSNVHNTHGSYKVIDFSYLRPVPPVALDPEHPWVTGISPHTGRPIWPGHVLFATPRRDAWAGPAPDADEVIVTRIGRFLMAMVQRSQAQPEIAHGPRRRMPHAVNYLHGAIHFNGVFLLFNDLAEARAYLEDPAFRREIRRFAREERRELTLVMRERRYDPLDFAWFIGFVRARLPWYANPNGPGEKRVLYGTPSPYPAVNIITGNWIRDVERLRRGERESLARPPVDRCRWFRGPYRPHPAGYAWLERFHAWGCYQTIRVKRFQGGLAFTRRRRIEPQNWERYLESGRTWRAEYRVPHPFRRWPTTGPGAGDPRGAPDDRP
jgi:hypothetical protein